MAAFARRVARGVTPFAKRFGLQSAAANTQDLEGMSRRFFSTEHLPGPLVVPGCVANDAAAFVRDQLPEGWTPHIGLMLGSGMGEIADSIDVEVTIPYSNIPDFPIATVSGHAGELILGKLNGLNVACFQGRVHLYEGMEPSVLRVPIYTMRLLGCEQYIATTAVGSLMAGGVLPGDLVALTDHINLQGRSALVGNNDPIGPRFVDMINAYDHDLRETFKAIARKNDIKLYEGIYAALLGPSFETPAEIGFLRTIHADVVGMSCVNEVTLARHAGLKCAAIAVVVNHAAGLSDGGITHDETLHFSGRAAAKLQILLKEYCAAMLSQKHNDFS